MRTRYKNWVLPLLFMVNTFFMITSCKKQTGEEAPEPQITNMDQLKVDPSFTFLTTREVSISITLLDNTDAPVPGMRVDVYTDFPDNGGKMMVSGITDERGEFLLDYRIPAYLKRVAIGTPAIGFVNMQTVEVNDGKIACILGGKSTPTITKSGETWSYKSTNSLYVPMGSFNSQGVPNYLEPVNDIIDAAMIDDINATLPEKISAVVSHPQYFVSTNESNLVLDQACNVWVTFVHEGAGYRNVLGFYTYNTNNPPSSVNDIDTIHIIFPNVSFQGSGGGLKSGNKVHLGAFGPGTEIAWMLIADGFVNGSVTNGKNRFYSDKNLNPESSNDLRQHTIFCNDIGRGKFLLGFEDLRRDGSTDNDFNDAIFYVTADPIQSVNTANIPLPDYTQSDSDGDGISNVFDDYPNDASRAFNNYYPSQNAYGTLAFEDLWPQQGDYDMNDIVIDYNFNQVTNGQNKVIQIIGTLKFRAMGAGYRNGFGIQFPVPASQVLSATGSVLTESYITNLPNGIEAGQSKATIIVFDNGYNVLLHPKDQFVGVNTSQGCIYVEPVTLNINISLINPVTLSQMGTPPYNPFIIVNKTRGREVHLINKPPTDLADPSLFGTGQDNSIPGAGKYYATANNLPWAFDIIDPFEYPYEKKPILQGYLKFVPWSLSLGSNYFDWFMPKPGYRDNQYIFQP